MNGEGAYGRYVSEPAQRTPQTRRGSVAEDWVPPEGRPMGFVRGLLVAGGCKHERIGHDHDAATLG